MVLCFGLIAIIAGCGNTYRYKNEIFYSPEKALAAQKADLDDLKSKITPTEKKHGGTAAVVIPTFETFVALGITKQGNPAKELTDYMGNYQVADYRALSDSIDRRKIFDKVSLIEDKYPIPAVKKIIKEYDAVIYLNLVGPGQAQWFMKAAPNYKEITLNFDNSKTGAFRIISWLDNVEKNLDESGYIPKR